MNEELERYEPTEGTEAAAIQRRAREAGVEAHALRPKAGPDGERRTTITFFGTPRRVPDVGDSVELRAEDGSWQSGYRTTTEVTTDEGFSGEDVVWIATEDEWNAAESESRSPAGAPWPLAQMRPAEG